MPRQHVNKLHIFDKEGLFPQYYQMNNNSLFQMYRKP